MGNAIDAAAGDWTAMPAIGAGFTADLAPRLDRAVAEKRVWNIHSVVVVRGGRIVLERYFEGEDNARGRALGKVAFSPDVLHDLRSVSKSIVGLLYGIALAEGKVPPPEAALLMSFPEYPDIASDPAHARWTVENALTMTLGTDWDELSVPYSDPENSEIAMDRAPDRYRFVLAAPVVVKPGVRWIYNGGATAVLARILEKGTALRSARPRPDGVAHGWERRDLSGLGPTHAPARPRAHRPHDAARR
jgi:CubicO group peptidase (beta-lactamase class C family)